MFSLISWLYWSLTWKGPLDHFSSEIRLRHELIFPAIRVSMAAAHSLFLHYIRSHSTSAWLRISDLSGINFYMNNNVSQTLPICCCYASYNKFWDRKNWFCLLPSDVMWMSTDKDKQSKMLFRMFLLKCIKQVLIMDRRRLLFDTGNT